MIMSTKRCSYFPQLKLALCIGLKSKVEFIARGLIILLSAKKKSLFNLWRQVI
jgi:hypothetical protein